MLIIDFFISPSRDIFYRQVLDNIFLIYLIVKRLGLGMGMVCKFQPLISRGRQSDAETGTRKEREENFIKNATSIIIFLCVQC